MPLPDFRTLNPHGQIRAAELDRLGRELVAQDHLTGGGPEMTVGRSAGGFQVGVQLPQSFWARITGSGAGTPTPHSWVQLLENTNGTTSTDNEGRTGTTTSFPAYALDGGMVTTNRKVRLFLAQGGEFYLFDAGGGGSTVSMPNFHGCRLTLGITQSIPTNTETVIDWSIVAESFDTDNFFDNVSGGDQTVFTCPFNGVYLVGANILWDDTAPSPDSLVGTRTMRIRLDESTRAQAAFLPPGADSHLRDGLGVSVLQLAGVNQRFDVTVWQDSGSDREVRSAAPTNFWIIFLGEVFP